MTVTQAGDRLDRPGRAPPGLGAFAAAVFVAQLLVISLFVLTSTAAETKWLYTSASVLCRVIAAGCIVFGLWYYRPVVRTVWLLLLARCLWSALFILLRNAYISDSFWWALDGVAGTVLYVAVAAVLVQRRAAARDRSVWTDVAVICLGAAFVLYSYLGAPLFAARGGGGAVVLNSFVLPALDVVLIALVLLLTFTLRGRNLSLLLLLAAFALVPLGDIAVQLAMLGELNMQPRQTWAPFSLIFTALLGLAALPPSMRLIEQGGGSATEPWGRARTLLIVAAFLFTVGGVLQWSHYGASVYVLAGVLALMFVLVVARAYYAMRLLAASRATIERAATHDAGSGLLNSYGLADRCARSGGTAPAAGKTLILLRLRQTHEIGQLWGSAVRDRWIVRLAAALAAATQPYGILARIGSDQFALLTELRGEALAAAARCMADAVRTYRADDGTAIVAVFDIGIADGGTCLELDDLMHEAEAALSIAQAQGENRIAYYDDAAAAAAQRRFSLLASLRGAAARNELALCYQPVVDLATRQVVGCEALLRWSTPKLGPVAPAEFIPLAESIDVIEEITDWVLETACAALAAGGAGSVRQVSINISARSLLQPGLARRVLGALQRHALPPASLCLELTERAQMEDAHGELALLRQAGVPLAIDDFGSGYSNIAMLARLRADKVKLDMSFVRALEGDTALRKFCTGLLAHISGSGATCIAEGIESEAQHALLRSLGCQCGQGWLYGPALPRLPLLREVVEQC